MAYPSGTVVNPTLPYNCPVPGGIQNGKTIIIQGCCHHNSFSINLCMTPQVSPLPDTALHINPRFNEGAIVRNTQQYGGWGSEERSGGMPLRKGQPFEIIILVTQSHYKISVNGRHFANYNYRVAKETAQYLIVQGEVNISYIKFEGGASPAPPSYPSGQPIYNPSPAPPGYPYGQPTYHPSPAQPAPPGYAYGQPTFNPSPAPPGGPGQPIFNPPTPFTTPIAGGLYPGRMIYVSGVPHPNVSRFTVNLMCGPSEQGNIGLHFDVRFNYGGVYNQTVRTHKVGSTWGTEERHQTHFPFTPNVNFDMIILVEASCIKIAVNNQHFTEFNHRLQPMNQIDYLNVNGDLRLTSVRVQ